MKKIFLLYVLFFTNYIFAAPIAIDIPPDFFKNNLESILLILWVTLASYIMMYRKEHHDGFGLTVMMTVSLVILYFSVKGT